MMNVANVGMNVQRRGLPKLRKLVLPLAAATMMAVGLGACNKNQATKSCEDGGKGCIEYAIEQLNDGDTIAAKAFVNNVFVNGRTFDEMKNELNQKTEDAYAKFIIKGDKNTREDSLDMSNMIKHRKETLAAINYLQAQRAIFDAEQAQINPKKAALLAEQNKKEDSIAKANIMDYGSELSLLYLNRLSNTLDKSMKSTQELLNQLDSLSNVIEANQELSE